MNPLADALDALLPQTQCTRCAYPACRPYADAMAAGEASPNLCEPGGSALIPLLAQLLQRAPAVLAHPEPLPHVAWIREEDCIGCARCLPACPVDAIVGARRLAHGVLTEDCTGCDRCLPPCPVDCIELRPPPADWQMPAAALNRMRWQQHQQRWPAQRPEAGAVPAATLHASAPDASAPDAEAPDASALAASAPDASAMDWSNPDTAAPGPDVPGATLAERRATLIAAAATAAEQRRAARRNGPWNR